MKKRLQIKICGMCNPLNIKEVDALRPDYLGIIFYKESPRCMDKNPDAIPETNATKVGVFVDKDIEYIIKKAREFKLKVIQLHGNETPETCDDLMELGYDVFKAFKISDETKVTEIYPFVGKCTAFLFDTKSDKPGGSGKKFNWEKLDEMAELFPFFLSGGIGIDDIESIKKLNYENLIGLDLNSRFESEPGMKDTELLQAFISKI